MPKTPEISLVVPTIEEESVFKLIKDARNLLGKDTEIIVVDKSSQEYKKRLLKTGVKVLNQKDRGVENAIMLGLRTAKGQILASTDADGTHSIDGLKKGFDLIKAGKADIVLGNRMNGLQEGSMEPYLRFGNMVLSSLFSIVYNTKVEDVLTGLFVMKKSAFQKIKNITPYRAGIAFFVIELAKRGYRVGEVDIKYYARKNGVSKLAKSKFAFGVGVASHILSK